MSILRLQHLSKSLPHGFWMRHRPVLHDVTLAVEPGEVYGFLGPNGAGKTTTIKCLMGLLIPDGGTVEVLGEAAAAGAGLGARARLGYLPEHPYFYPHLSGRELLEYFGRLFDLGSSTVRSRGAELLETVGLAGDADMPIRQYSKGMMQRLGIAQALINEPELVVLDEPMTGLDPIGRREIKEIVEGLRQVGTTVFFSSHILSDAEALCDRVGLLYGGRMVREGHLDELLEERVRYWEAACEGPSADVVEGFEPFSVQGDRAFYRIDDPGDLDRWVDAARQAGGRVVSVSAQRATLEEYFLATVGGVDGGGGDAGASSEDSGDPRETSP